MKKNILIISGIFLVILALAVISNRRLEKLQNNLKEGTTFELESLGLEGLKEIPSAATESKTQMFISPDGKLQIEYPADFMVVGEGGALMGLTPEPWADKYNLETLFFTAKMQGEGLTQLIVYRGNFNITIPEIVSEMKNLNEEQGLQTEIISSDFQEKRGVFEARYKTPQGYIIHSREKILVSEDNEVFLIAGLAAETNWPQSRQTIDKILNSATIIGER